MGAELPYDVFLSHGAKDKAVVRPLAVAVVIAVFALIASMATAVIERRWEMGMLRALGLRRSQLFRMFLGEALGVTLSAGLAGG